MNRVKYDSKREGYKFNYSFDKLKESITEHKKVNIQHGGSMTEKGNNELLFSQDFYKNKTLKIYKLADDVLKI